MVGGVEKTEIRGDILYGWSLIKELSWFVASISYTKGYFRTVMMLNFHAFEYSSGIAPSKVKKKNPNDLKLAHDMEWCHVPFAYQIGPGLI